MSSIADKSQATSPAKKGGLGRLFSRKAKAAAPAAGGAMEDGASAPARPKRLRKILMIAIPALVVLGGGGAGAYVYLGMGGETAAAEHGATADAHSLDIVIPPVASAVATQERAPGDYQIVMVFQDEAVLAAANQLLRVKVGSSVPGLGEVLSIKATENGGTVEASNATLRTVVQ